MAITSEFGTAIADQLRRSVDDDRRVQLWSSPSVDRQLWKQFADSSWFAALLPESDDGLGLEPPDIIDAFEAIGRHLVPGPFFEHMLVVPLLVRHGTSTVDLAASIGGDSLLSWWDPEAIGESAATVTFKDGAVTGTLDGVRFAVDADALCLVADADGQPVVVYVPNGPDLREPQIGGVSDGMTRPGRLLLRDIPARVLLEGPAVAPMLAEVRRWLRVAAAVQISGATSWQVSAAVEYAKLRRQFGQPIGGFQAVSHLLADMAVHDIALQNLCAATLTDPLDDLTALIVNAHAATAGLTVAETGLQVHGGVGFTREHPLHMYFTHVLALWAWYGDPDRLAVQIGRLRVGGAA